jgi:hypothetical protein
MKASVMTVLGTGSVRVLMQIGAIESSCVVKSLEGRHEMWSRSTR